MSRHFLGVPFHSKAKGEFYKMNEEKKSETDNLSVRIKNVTAKKIAGIYIRVSTEEQVRERI